MKSASAAAKGTTASQTAPQTAPQTASQATAQVAAKAAPGGKVLINVFDGTRQLMAAGKDTLITIRDGFQNQTQISRPGPSIDLEGLTIYNNLGDSYAFVAFVDGYDQAGFYPIPVSANVHQVVNLMLLPKNGSFHFAHARWQDIQNTRPQLAQLLQASVTGDVGDFYGQLLETQAPTLACFLNITTAMSQIFLPNATLLDYLKAVKPDDLHQDRFYAWAKQSLLVQLQQAVYDGEFEQESSADLLLHSDPTHGPATSSFKQIQFGEANLQLTFHGGQTKVIGGETCVLVEPDIDYYKDLGAHALLEVIPNALTGNLTDPKVVYVLRWIAGQHAGIPEFDPLYTIEA